LKEAGKEVLILEARDRIGGRAYTIYDYGAPIDLGCQWFHYHENHNPMFDWVKKRAKKKDFIETKY